MKEGINISCGGIGCFGCVPFIIGLVVLYWLLFDGGILKILELLRSI